MSREGASRAGEAELVGVCEEEGAAAWMSGCGGGRGRGAEPGVAPRLGVVVVVVDGVLGLRKAKCDLAGVVVVLLQRRSRSVVRRSAGMGSVWRGSS